MYLIRSLEKPPSPAPLWKEGKETAQKENKTKSNQIKSKSRYIQDILLALVACEYPQLREISSTSKLLHPLQLLHYTHHQTKTILYRFSFTNFVENFLLLDLSNQFLFIHQIIQTFNSQAPAWVALADRPYSKRRFRRN